MCFRPALVVSYAVTFDQNQAISNKKQRRSYDQVNGTEQPPAAPTQEKKNVPPRDSSSGANILEKYINCSNVDDLPPDLDNHDQLSRWQSEQPEAEEILRVSNKLGPKHPVVFGGSLGTLVCITILIILNFPPTTNIDKITKCHCWQKDDGKLGEKCLQVIIDWIVDILVHVYGKNRDTSEKLARSIVGFVDICSIAGPGDWHSNPHTAAQYESVAQSVRRPTTSMIQRLVDPENTPSLESVLVLGGLPCKYWLGESE